MTHPSLSTPVLPIGVRVQKTSGKPFKSGRKINTINGTGTMQIGSVSRPTYRFEEDESEVECWRCEEVK